jgi:hypothetical protein
MTISALKSTQTPPCSHNHLFEKPFCKSNSLIKKIAIVAFHVFTLCIPLVVYKLINCLSGRVKPQKVDEKLKKEIEEFINKELENVGDVDKQYAGLQPVNKLIDKLTYLLYERHVPVFEKVIREHKSDWNHPEVIQAADKMMKCSYLIGIEMLADLKAFGLEHKRDIATSLVKQDAYQYRAFFLPTTMYHEIRGAYKIQPQPWFEDDEGNIPEELMPKGQPNSDYAKLFYKPGTIQNTWWKLYNDYCTRVTNTISVETLRQADDRFTKWTVLDTGIKSFNPVPSTQPT